MSKRISCSVSIYILTNKYCKIIVLYLKNKLNVNITKSHLDIKNCWIHTGMWTVLDVFQICFLFVNMVTYFMHVDITKLHVDFITLHNALTL